MVKPEDLKAQTSMWFKNNKTKQPKPFSQTHQIFQPIDSWNFISSSQMPRKLLLTTMVINFFSRYFLPATLANWNEYRVEETRKLITLIFP